MNNSAYRDANYRLAYLASPTYRRARRREVLRLAAAIGFIALTLVGLACAGFWGLGVILERFPPG
jgi:hypothetical protein